MSMKWQEASETAEQKVPFEVLCFADAVRELGCSRPHISCSVGQGGRCATGTLACITAAIEGRQVSPPS